MDLGFRPYKAALTILRWATIPYLIAPRTKHKHFPAMPLQLAHLSDIHLDGDPQKDSGVHLRFLNALEHAVSDAPDFLLLVGDLFESNRVSEACIDWAMRTLESQPCPVVMIPGNHDCLDAEAIFKRFDFNQIQNVVILSNPDGQVHLDADRDVAFWGRGMVDHIPSSIHSPTYPSGRRASMVCRAGAWHLRWR